MIATSRVSIRMKMPPFRYEIYCDGEYLCKCDLRDEALRTAQAIDAVLQKPKAVDKLPFETYLD